MQKMPRPRKQTLFPVEKAEERSSGGLKLVLRLPVPKDPENSVSGEADLCESEENLVSDEDDENSLLATNVSSIVSEEECSISHISSGAISFASSVDVQTTSSSSKKKRKKRKFKLTMPTQRVPKARGRKGENETGEKEAKKPKKILTEFVEPKIEPEESLEIIKSPSPAVPDYSPLQLLLDNILKTFERKDPDNFFMQPVTDDIAPNYSTLITNPMDFSTMRRKMEAGEYKNLKEFRADVDLIAKNAITYNEPGSVYHLAAKKLTNMADFLFSKEKLLFLQKTCHFMSQLGFDDLGVDLSKPVTVKDPKPPLANYACIVDDMSAEDVYSQVAVAARAVASRLAARKPNCRTVCVSSFREGTCTLKLLTPEKTFPEEKTYCLSDVAPKLKEGNPGMPRFEENPANLVVPYNYLDYGPFASFAPLYDSTWATLSKEDSDLLLSTYGGDETSVEYVNSMKNYVNDSSDDLIRMVDGVLDALTDGEHSKSLKNIKNKNSKIEEQSEDLAQEIDFRNLDHQISAVDAKLAETGMFLSNLRNIQYERLSQQPPFVLTDAPGPSVEEAAAAQQVLTNLQILTAQAAPGEVVNPESVRNLMGVCPPENIEQTDSNGSDEYDMDVFREFFQVENGT